MRASAVLWGNSPTGAGDEDEGESPAGATIVVVVVG